MRYNSGCFASGVEMKRFVQSEDRKQGVLLPDYLDDYVRRTTLRSFDYSIARSQHCPTAAFPFGGEEKSSGRAEGVRSLETRS
jgi:hypothetical protein